ncbi:hypothetical protein, partial [Salmonella sp. s51944]|uniref:hypothetical protein n=1 Tax=Salmonella sp. s51944 TaxID=3159655 RepID=UPI00398145AB
SEDGHDSEKTRDKEAFGIRKGGVGKLRNKLKLENVRALPKGKLQCVMNTIARCGIVKFKSALPNIPNIKSPGRKEDDDDVDKTVVQNKGKGD